jgi:copper homeostasis protein (lipoprotein)
VISRQAASRHHGSARHERESGRVVLRGGREAPVFLLPVDGGAALRKLDLHGKPIDSAHNDRLQRQPQFKPFATSKSSAH